MDTRFHCVYLLTSLDPQCQGDYYIGYTVNPLRRLRQHNGELVNGARRTGRRGRPWTIVCCVSGFTEDRAALKFEWCWQNPTVSARLKHTVGVLKGLRRLPYAVGTLHLLVRAPLFNQLDLTLHVFESDLLHEAQAKAEVFLAMRGGPRPHPATTSPHRSCTEASPTDQASPVVSTQVLNGSSAYGSAASPTSLLLPPLEPSVLFHVEVLTRQRFEDVYLSHDRCLLLPSVGVGGGGSSSFAAEHDGEDSCLSASCPYDVSVLSQAARAEWSNASFDDDAVVAAEGRDQQQRATSDDGADDTDGGSMTQRFGLRRSPTPSRTPSPCWAEPRGGTPDVMLGYRSEERVGEGNTVELASSPSVSASRASSNASTVALSSPSQASADVRSATAASVSPPRAPSPPPPLMAVTAEVDAGLRPRIPLRFAHYSDADFAGLHADEQYRLHHGLLPCTLCALPLQPPCVVHCSRAPFCELRCHLSCLAMWMLYEEEGINGATLGSCDEQRHDDTLVQQQQQQQQQQHTQSGTPVPFRRLIPSQPCPCPLCGVLLQWGGLIKALKKRVVVEERLQAAQRRTRIEQRWQARLAQINGHRPARGRRSCRRKRPRVEGSTPAPVMAVRPAVSGTSHTTGHNSQPLSAVPSPGAPQLAASSIPLGEVSSLSPIGAPAPPTDASLLSWTAFCEDEWLV